MESPVVQVHKIEDHKFRRKQTDISDFPAHSVQLIIPSGAKCNQVEKRPSGVNAA
jgi:hypothetical protein